MRRWLSLGAITHGALCGLARIFQAFEMFIAQASGALL
jgi:hypothetical protein